MEILRLNLAIRHHWILRLSHLLLLIVVILEPALVEIHLRLLGLIYCGLVLNLWVLHGHLCRYWIYLRHIVEEWIQILILLLDIGCITDLILLVEIEPILASVWPSLRPHRKLIIV